MLRQSVCTRPIFFVSYGRMTLTMTLFETDRNRPMQELLNTLSLRDAAVFYAQHGWPVFPLAGKVPYDGMHGHKDATTEEAVIDHWWSEHPKANIGLATGSTS